jgi:single-strand DNA-binding protein
MPSLNQIQLIGNLGKKPEMNYTPKGVAVTKFSMAVDQGIGQNKGTLWLNIVIFGRVGDDGLAGRMNDWLYKGCKVFCQGTLVVRDYTGKDGIERKSIEVIASMVEILSPRSEKPAEEEIIQGEPDLEAPF